MPIIKGYTAGGAGGGVPRFNVPRGVDDPAAGVVAGAAGTIGQAANKYAQAQGAINAQRDENDFLGMKVEWDTRIQAIEQDLAHDMYVVNQPETYETEFSKRAKEAQTDILGKNPNTNAGKLFGLYFQQEYPKNLIKARGEGLRLQAGQAVGDINELGNKIATMAPTITPEKLDEYIKNYNTSVNTAFNRGFLKSPEEREKLLHNIKFKTQDSMMQYMAETNWDSLRRLQNEGAFNFVPGDVQAKHLARANELEHQTDVRTKQVLEDASKLSQNYLMTLAAADNIDQSVIDDIRAGRNPLIADPLFADKLEHRRDNPPNSAGDDAARFVVTELALKGPTTRANVENAMQKMSTLLEKYGPTKVITQEARHLEALHGQVRSIESSELSNANKYLDTKMEATSKPTMPGPMGQVMRNKEKIEEAKIREQVMKDRGLRTKEEVDKMVEQLRKKQQERRANQDQQQKDVDIMRRGK